MNRSIKRSLALLLTLCLALGLCACGKGGDGGSQTKDSAATPAPAANITPMRAAAIQRKSCCFSDSISRLYRAIRAA